MKSLAGLEAEEREDPTFGGPQWAQGRADSKYFLSIARLESAINLLAKDPKSLAIPEAEKCSDPTFGGPQWAQGRADPKYFCRLLA